MIKNQTLKALRHLLQPLVRVLLRNGVTWSEFAELGKEVFVEVARSDYGIQGRPTNTSRVALMTGLSRREVTRVKKVLAGDRAAEEPPANRISQILTAWHVDGTFLARDGKPAVLPLTGEGASVATLLKRYAGNMPHGAILKELEQLGLVKRARGGLRVTSREYIRSRGDPDGIRQGGIALHDHATTIAHNVDAERIEAPRLERMATSRALLRRHVAAYRELLQNEAQGFLERIDAWLAAHSAADKAGSTKRSTDERTVRAGVGIFQIHDETEPRGRQ